MSNNKDEDLVENVGAVYDGPSEEVVRELGGVQDTGEVVEDE